MSYGHARIIGHRHDAVSRRMGYRTNQLTIDIQSLLAGGLVVTAPHMIPAPRGIEQVPPGRSACPDTAAVAGDEDKVQGIGGSRAEPHFKTLLQLQIRIVSETAYDGIGIRHIVGMLVKPCRQGHLVRAHQGNCHVIAGSVKAQPAAFFSRCPGSSADGAVFVINRRVASRRARSFAEGIVGYAIGKDDVSQG